jgi:hypothetical protein
MSEFSGENAKEHTARITQFYRSPGSSGIHAATQYIKGQLEKHNPDHILVETYPIDGTATIFGETIPPAWEPRAGVLKIAEPVEEELVDYEQTPTCLEWYSTPTPRGGMTAEVIDVGSGTRTEEYEGKNLQGKIAFASGGGPLDVGVRLYNLAVEKFGAIGVVTDYLLGDIPGIRDRKSRPDFVGLLRQRRDFDKGWSIVISGTKGARLRELLKRGRVKLWVKIDTIVSKRSGENLIATIRGSEKPEEEVIVIGHTSATKPAANCASGPALMIEMARTLMKLIRTGRISRPRRSIQFLFVCEGLGTLAYMQGKWNQRNNMLGAICLCGVGEDQEKCKSSLTISRTPDSVPSFLNDLSEHVLMETCRNKILRSGPIRVTVNPYNPHSDNMTLNLMGVPCVLMHSNPSVYFHTQYLTADKTDPEIFRTSGLITLQVALEIANAGLEEATRTANIVAEASERRLSELCVQMMDHLAKLSGKKRQEASGWWRRRLTHVLKRDIDAINSTTRLILELDKPAKVFFNRTARRLCDNVTAKKQQEERKLNLMTAGLTKESKSARASSQVTPKKVEEKFPPSFFYPKLDISYEGMVEMIEQMRQVDASIQGSQLRQFIHELYLHSDGENTLSDISERIGFEYGVKIRPEHLLPFAESLERYGSIRLKTKTLKKIGSKMQQ